MSNMETDSAILIAFFLFVQGYAVDFDYYADEKSYKDNAGDISQDSRKDVNAPQQYTANEATTTAISIHIDNKEDHKVGFSYGKSQEEDLRKNSVKLNNMNFPMQLFKEYEYVYGEKTRNESRKSMLHEQIPDELSVTLLDSHEDYENNKLKEDDEEDGTNITNAPKSEELSNSTNNVLFNTDLLFLNPAAEKLIPEIHLKMTKNDVENVWYVPEKYPCWELPLLFGKMDQHIKDDVFLIYAGDLSDVVHDTFQVPVVKMSRISKNVDTKWCEQEPCYGDHTLCLFPDDTVSQICDKNYKVSNPNLYEQTTIINTINSMRNRIALQVAGDYAHLPPAANMQQMMYDADLARMANRWLLQCLPGVAACSSLNNELVTQLECTKIASGCCLRPHEIEPGSQCIPRAECFVPAVIGCLHAWFLSAGNELQERDIECGHVSRRTLNTAQIIWAVTNKIGCAYGERENGDIRVVCNFAPGATFVISTKFFCGILSHDDVTSKFSVFEGTSITDLDYLAAMGIVLNEVYNLKSANVSSYIADSPWFNLNTTRHWGVSILSQMYGPGEIRRYQQDNFVNGTVGAVARLVTRYSFYEDSESRCDTDEPVYVIGPPGSSCKETGSKFGGLCYSFRDPYPGYRWVAILAPIGLFMVILYDLFGSVLRQTN